MFDLQETDIKIRLAKDDDFDRIFSIWFEGLDNSFDIKTHDVEMLKEKFYSNFISRGGIFNFWIAIGLKTEEALGWQSLIRTSNNPFREELFAESSTYIAKQYRKTGIGKMLLVHMAKEAEKSSLNYITGFISVNNMPARKLTKELGWIEIGQIPAPLKGEHTHPKIFVIKQV